MNGAQLRRRFFALRALAIAMLSIAVSFGGALATYARLVADAPAHACHCEARGGHAHCACPICFPELVKDDAASGRTDELGGKCGDDDPGWRTLSQRSVPSAGYVVVGPSPVRRAPRAAEVPSSPREWSTSPDPRPPRSDRSPRVG